MKSTTRLHDFLLKHYSSLFPIVASLTAFATYSSMYAFRKPYTVASFSGYEFWGVDYKVLLITAQVIGYTLSKFLGIKVVSEMKAGFRGKSIVLLVGLAGVALSGFALVPAPWNIIFLFLNGLPLGMIWGLVFSFLEGRKTTEFLGAVLCVSFIFSSGFVKSVGSFLMVNLGVSEFWMPVATASIFFIPLLLFVYILTQLPEPTGEDVEMRTERKPMSNDDRDTVFRNFAPGIVLMVIVYTGLTIYRDVRDNFAAEIWAGLGFSDTPHIFTTAEIPVSIFVLVLTALIVLVKDNRKAFLGIFYFIIVGFLMAGGATLLFQHGAIGPVLWMMLVGGGLYLGYVPFNAILFDRMIASFKMVSNVGFLIYISDAFGYLGSVAIYFVKNFLSPDISWLAFFIRAGYVFSFVGAILSVAAVIYFQIKLRGIHD